LGMIRKDEIFYQVVPAAEAGAASRAPAR
jgi:hypothetical protein